MSLFGIKEKEKIVELNILINSLKTEIIKMKEKEDELIKIIHKKNVKIKYMSKSPHERQLEKVTLEFDKVKTENAELILSNESLKEENMELIAKNHGTIERMIEIEKIAESLKEENKILNETTISQVTSE